MFTRMHKLALVSINFLDHAIVIILCNAALSTILLNDECSSIARSKTKMLPENTPANSCACKITTDFSTNMDLNYCFYCIHMS